MRQDERGCWRHLTPNRKCEDCVRKAKDDKDPTSVKNIMKPGSPIHTAIFS